MSRRLIFNGGSPYARKVRIVLAELALEHESQVTGFPPPEDLARLNPNLTVPVFLDGELELFESNLIIEYLLATYGASRRDEVVPLSASLAPSGDRWRDAKILATAESLADSLVNHAYMTWTGMKSLGPNLVGFDWQARQLERARSCLAGLEREATGEGFSPGVFSIQDIALICPLLWNEARLRLPLGDHPKLGALVDLYRERPSVVATAPSDWTPER